MPSNASFTSVQFPRVLHSTGIEFVISGSVDGRQKVLVKSSNAQLDIIGAALSATDALSIAEITNGRVGLKNHRVINLEGGSLCAIHAEYDEYSSNKNNIVRKGIYNFVWRSERYKYNSHLAREFPHLSGYLKQVLGPILLAIENGEDSELELEVAPLVYAIVKGREYAPSSYLQRIIYAFSNTFLKTLNDSMPILIGVGFALALTNGMLTEILGQFFK